MACSARLPSLRGRHAQCFQTELHILQNRQPGKQREPLEDHGNAVGRPLDGFAQITNFTDSRQIETRDHAQQRRLGRTRAPQQPTIFTFAQRDIHALEDDELVPVSLLKACETFLHRAGVPRS